MTRAKVEREVAAAVLGGDQPVPQLLRAGLETLQQVRRLLAEPITAALERDGVRDYVWTGLPRGGKLLVHLRDRTRSQGNRGPIVTIARARSGKREFACNLDTEWRPGRAKSTVGAIDLLTERLGTDVSGIVLTMLAVERARKQCYALAEEATRWL